MFLTVVSLRIFGDVLDSIPGVLTGGMLTYVARKCKHFAALPAAIAIIPISFYLVVFLSGHDLASAREFGWLGKLTQPADCVSVFKLYSISDVHWDVMPHQVPIWFAMTIVVAFSSCLDVSFISRF
jgi:MFS superfamily sulfate permease-like transporter